MIEREYASYADWYREGPFAAYIRACGMAGDAISVVEATQPAGDLSDPPINDLVLIRMLSPDAPCSIDLGAKRFTVSQRYGDFILVSPNTRSDIQMYSSHTVELFSLPAGVCLDLLGGEQTPSLDFGELHANAFRSDLLNAMCQRIVAASRAPHAASRLFVDSAASALLGEISRLAGTANEPAHKLDVRDWRMRRTIEHIDAHLNEDLPLATLAAAVNLSPARYTALFRTATGTSPHGWVLDRRIDRACDLLANSKTPITDVALSLGFSSSQHFATAFRARKGVTPTAWRRENAF